MKIGYFPGCSLHGTAPEYEQSLRSVCKFAGIELVEIEDWNCCGATAAHSLNKVLSVALPSRNLAIAEKMGLTEILVPCAACYSRFKFAQHEFINDEKIKTLLPTVLEEPFSGKVEILNIIDFIEKHLFDKIKEKIVHKFNHKAACYYGCLLVRPKHLTDAPRVEDPISMENILKKLGISSIDWAYKTECCGAGFSVTRTDIVGKLSGKILTDATDRGAEVIITACPMCQSNLDMRRKAIDKYLQTENKVPVIFITQIIGLALGFTEKEMGLEKLFIPYQLRTVITKEGVA